MLLITLVIGLRGPAAVASAASATFARARLSFPLTERRGSACVHDALIDARLRSSHALSLFNMGGRHLARSVQPCSLQVAAADP